MNARRTPRLQALCLAALLGASALEVVSIVIGAGAARDVLFAFIAVVMAIATIFG